MRRYDVMVAALTDGVGHYDLVNAMRARIARPDAAITADQMMPARRRSAVITGPHNTLEMNERGAMGYTPDDAGRVSLVEWPDLLAHLDTAATQQRAESIVAASADTGWTARLDVDLVPLRSRIYELATATATAAGLQQPTALQPDRRDVSIHDRSGPLRVMCDGHELAELRPGAFGRVDVFVAPQHVQDVDGHGSLWSDESRSEPEIGITHRSDGVDNEWTVTADGAPLLRLGEDGPTALRVSLLEAEGDTSRWTTELNMPRRPPECVHAAVERLTSRPHGTATANGLGR